jgi:hypothetical protein
MGGLSQRNRRHEVARRLFTSRLVALITAKDDKRRLAPDSLVFLSVKSAFRLMIRGGVI